ncbi:RabGAP/TBC [Histomonas meleagridis]|uniref:RabGAP/TBC n=1 Tax=Histomonas meleagridis TaxID=135588 RepID=UPI003559531A|nr:RabGAP/TBC [Histomonas meleagridis]KAH0799013.1 RabGAP/TBC [Histomonas meleagridis]
MALSAEQFQEILDEDILVDREKLFTAAKYGVPESVRGKVWMYLLNVSDNSHQFEGKAVEERTRYYNSLRPNTFPYIKNAVNTAIHNMMVSSFADKRIYFKDTMSSSIYNILSNYFSCEPNMHFTPGIVNLTIPLYIASGRDEVSSFFMLSSLSDRINTMTENSIHLRYASKLSKFIKIFMPELANHFGSEAIDLDEIFVHWFQYLHSTALPLSSLLRLWDRYLSISDSELPRTVLFVSLALVDRLMPKLVRMEHIEIKNFLSNLPLIDMDVLLVQADTLKSQFEALYSSEFGEDEHE